MLVAAKSPSAPQPYQEKVGQIIKKAEACKEARRQRAILDEEVAFYFYPERRGFTTENWEGKNYQDDLFTSGPQIARRKLAQIMGATMRPPGQIYARATPDDIRLTGMSEVRQWCEIVTQITHAVINDRRSQYAEATTEADHDVCTFGWAAIYYDVVMAKPMPHMIFQCIPPKDVVFKKNSYGIVDSAYRWRSMNITQIGEMFGEEYYTKSMRDELRKKVVDLERKWTILHCVFPNEQYAYYGLGPGRLPYTSLWICVEDKELLDASGYYEFPYIVPMWETVTGEVMGRAPAYVALNDARVSNAIAQTLLDAGEKAANPPLTAPADMIRGEIELVPGGLTLYDATAFSHQGQPVMPIDLGKNMPLTLEMLQGYEQRIAQAFFLDTLTVPEFAPRTTAAQVNAEMQEYLRTAGPVFGRIDAGYNQVMFEQIFTTLQREGAYPPPPPELQGQSIRFEYDGPIRQAERKARAYQNLEAAQALIPFAQVWEEVAENIDPDALTRLSWQDLGGSEFFLRHPEAVAEARERRLKAQQMQMMAEMANKAAPALKASGDVAAMADDRGMLPSPEQAIQAAEEIPVEDLEEAIG